MPDIIQSGHINSPSDGVTQGLYEESSAQQGNVGAIRRLGDGRTYRYCYFAAAVNPGVLCTPDISAGGVVDEDNALTAAAIGATTVTATDQTLLENATADQYAGAYMHLSDGPGEGFTYRIKGNTKATDAYAVDFRLYDPLVVAVTTATDFAITPFLYNNVMIATVNADCLLCGVSVRAMQATYYGWVQTSGIATILAEMAITPVGIPLTLSDSTAGAVQVQDAFTEPVVGLATYLADGQDGDHVGVILQLGSV